MAKRENIFVYNFTGKCYDIGDKYGVCHTGYMFIEWCCLKIFIISKILSSLCKIDEFILIFIIKDSIVIIKIVNNIINMFLNQ